MKEIEKKKENSVYSKERTKKYDEKIFLEKQILKIKRVVKMTKGGAQKNIAALFLFKNPEKNSISFIYSKAKNMNSITRKSVHRAKKKMINYFPEKDQKKHTISKSIIIKYKSTKLFIKPTKAGSGVKAGGVLNFFFNYLGVTDITAKIIGSKNKLNVIKAGFIAANKLYNKEYVF